MNFLLNDAKIKKLCGTAAYKKGKSYFQAGKVVLHPVSQDDVVKADVLARNPIEVTVKQQTDGEVSAECSCPPVGFVKTYCQHIAGVLLAIDDMQQRENPMAAKMLGLFGSEPQRPSGKQLHFDYRPVLEVEFICRPVQLQEGGHVIGVQLNAGINGLRRIRNAAEFLTAVELSRTVEVAPNLIYSPEAFSFSKETDALLHILVKSQHISKDLIALSASEWERILPLLRAAPSVKIEQGGKVFKGIRLEEELPLVFRFDEEKLEGYRLKVEGLEQIIVLKSYDAAMVRGALIKLPAEDLIRLAELKEMMGNTVETELIIPSHQADHFLETVIPGLERLGKVHIADAVSERLDETPLQAKLYLDRVKHRLLAGLEFHYGQLVINPCEEQDGEFRQLPGIRRQLTKEQRIMELMQESLFTQTDGGFYMQDEEAEYNFLYHVIPELEELLQVYATTAVKIRVQKNYIGPKIKVDMRERTDWLVFRFDLQDIPEKEIKQLLASLKEKRKYYRIPNGTLVSLETPEFIKLNDLMLEMALTAEELMGNEIRVPLIQGLRLVDSLEEEDLIDPGAGFAKLIKNLSSPENLDFDLPDGLEDVLRGYQKAGFNWLKALAKYRFGGILADDMGLGKTLQSIAFIRSELADIRRRKLPVLVVCPSSLTYNWMNELEKFAPEIKAVIIDGNKEKRTKLLNGNSDADVIITSYPSLRMDASLYRGKSFHTLFLDEAQTFKNPVTQTAKAVKTIEAECRFALTGTPIENSLDELWSIFHVVFPELLPNRRVFSEMRRGNIAKRVRPFILRRVKKDVLLELPEKIETTQFSELQPEQKKYYAAYLAELKQEALKHLNKDSFQKNRIRILAGLTRLRQLCCHPSLFVEDYEGGSAKFDQLLEILESSRASGRRVLVFSQFTQMLGIIGRHLARQGKPYFYLDGQTPPSERVAMCSRFNEGEGELFLISMKAGGTGLNLTGADTVILYDLWWNPAIEQQAADRAHRMGQQNEVQVIRLVAKGTIEEKITELQEKKKNLIDEVIQAGQEPLAAMTETDIRKILMI